MKTPESSQSSSSPNISNKRPSKIQEIQIIPNCVEFLYDSLGISQAEISLNNTSNNWFVFKVKTNAPEYFIVRPNQGQIPPNENIIISVSAKYERFTVFFLQINKK